jgi:hypothetical protein
MHPSPHFATSVLLANEPLAYRQALARVIETQRPDVQVVTVTPDELDVAIQEHTPLLVICDRLTELVEKCVLAWIVLYPAGARHVTSSFEGAEEIAGDLDLSAVLALLDRAGASITG